MTIKMIVSDLDNTLLHNDKTVSEYTLNVIQQCKAKGIKFVPATARAIRKLKEMDLYDLLPFDALVYLNGSQILLNSEVIYHQGISKEAFLPFLPELLKYFSNHRISIEVNDVMYVNHNIWEVDPKEKNYVLTKDFECLPDALIDRIIVEVHGKEDLHRIKEMIPDYLYAHGVDDAPICRILHRNVSKSNALSYLCHLWQIEPSEVVCFGDDENDFEMFDFCGQSIAMANAIDEIKVKATGITKSNEEDGVACWLEEMIGRANPLS